MRDKNGHSSGTFGQRAVIPLQLASERENIAIRGLACEELQGRFYCLAFSGVWSARMAAYIKSSSMSVLIVCAVCV